MTAKTSLYTDRLTALRTALAGRGVDGFLIPRADEYLGENVPDGAQRLKWISGFTGSAGCAIVLADKAAVLSDGRYTIQLAQQVDPALFSTADSTQFSIGDWLVAHARGKKIGFDPRLHTAAEIRRLEDKNITLVPLDANPVDAVWKDRPAPPCAPVTIFPETFAGISSREKIDGVVAALKEEGAQALILTLPDSIAWLLNIRGGDVARTPVALCHAIVQEDGTVQLFIDQAKLGDAVRTHLGNRVHIAPPETLAAELKRRAAAGQTLWVDEARAPYWFTLTLEQAGGKTITLKDPCIAPKARKTPAEQAAMKNAHVRDGIAMVRFLSALEEEAPGGTLSEMSVEEKLIAARAQAAEYRDTSFDTIAGFGPNGAIVHYRASEETNLKITVPGLLLLDSGAQYEDGTTDITRTVAIGMPSADMVRHYTLVLKGHIAVSRAKFPRGTTGAQIDALARAPLWQEGLDYAHGTGHGVGCYLSVHEEAASISTRGKDALEVGMILSNEPGYYREGHYGIRIENLVLVTEAGQCADTGKTLLAFETITLCPYDVRLIDGSLLDAGEKEWLRAYNARVVAALSGHLAAPQKAWLTRHTDEKAFT